jgi:hypothetical protein
LRQHAAFDLTAVYWCPVGIKGSLRRAAPALDPAQTPNAPLRHPLEIQQRPICSECSGTVEDPLSVLDPALRTAVGYLTSGVLKAVACHGRLLFRVVG